MTAITPLSAASRTLGSKTSLGDLDQGDFLKLMLAQMQQQDPFSPMDQTQMLAQMAQFSTLAGTSEMAETLKAISAQLDALVKARNTTPAAST